MSLTKYNQKRRFGETPEPKGKGKSSHGLLRFVVQKHQASHLHYDFRLEMGGVLKSWAVPKGPSLNPQDKRLAMMVEDHPVDYQNFEGHIPHGNYGAGDVIVWDTGTYYAVGAATAKESERLMEAGLKHGKADFCMQGQKLRGIFSLVKFKRGAENAWLLLKKGDRYASTKNILFSDASVLSKKTIANKKTADMRKKSKKSAGPLLPGTYNQC